MSGFAGVVVIYAAGNMSSSQEEAVSFAEFKEDSATPHPHHRPPDHKKAIQQQ